MMWMLSASSRSRWVSRAPSAGVRMAPDTGGRAWRTSMGGPCCGGPLTFRDGRGGRAWAYRRAWPYVWAGREKSTNAVRRLSRREQAGDGARGRDRGDRGVDDGPAGPEVRVEGWVAGGQRDLRRCARVDPLPLLEHFEVEVRPGGEAGLADIGHNLTLTHARARGYAARPARQVGVAGLQTRSVADLQPAAIAAVPTRFLDHAVARRQHRGADGGAEIHALVHAGEAQQRMQAHAEPGRQPR